MLLKINNIEKLPTVVLVAGVKTLIIDPSKINISFFFKLRFFSQVEKLRFFIPALEISGVWPGLRLFGVLPEFLRFVSGLSKKLLF